MVDSALVYRGIHYRFSQIMSVHVNGPAAAGINLKTFSTISETFISLENEHSIHLLVLMSCCHFAIRLRRLQHGRNTFLLSLHLCFIIVFICDLFVSRDDPLMS